MNICVCGWYFDSAIYGILDKISLEHRVSVVAHREIPGLMMEKMPYISWYVHDNIGLEFGAYQDYLMRIWHSGSVLFMHDDIQLSDSGFFDRVEKLDVDQAFLFRDEFEGKCNQNFHGRAFFCSDRFLSEMKNYECTCKQSKDYIDAHHNKYCSEACAKEMQFTGWDREQVVAFVDDDDDRMRRCVVCGKEFCGAYWGMGLRGTGPHKGFWVDPWNTGHHRGKPPVGVRHYNDEIYHFAMYCSHAKSPGIEGRQYNSRNVRFFSELKTGKRGII